MESLVEQVYYGSGFIRDPGSDLHSKSHSHQLSTLQPAALRGALKTSLVHSECAAPVCGGSKHPPGPNQGGLKDPVGPCRDPV